MYVDGRVDILRLPFKQGGAMSSTRSRRIKELKSNPYSEPDVFYMSLDEAKDAIASKYEFLAERFERAKPKRVRTGQS